MPDTEGTEPKPAEEAPAPDTKPKGGSKRSFLREMPVLVGVALVLAILLKTFLVQAFWIPSPSMEPTLKYGDRVLVNKVVYHLRDIHRGDIIVFSNPHPEQVPDRGMIGGFLHWLGEGIGAAQPENEDYIKRVIGLPGDAVEEREGSVYVNGEKVDEPYLPQGVTTSMNGVVFHVPADHLFVMGDNRGDSADSRSFLGYIPLDNVIGKAFVRIWPPSRWAGLG